MYLEVTFRLVHLVLPGGEHRDVVTDSGELVGYIPAPYTTAVFGVFEILMNEQNSHLEGSRSKYLQKWMIPHSEHLGFLARHTYLP